MALDSAFGFGESRAAHKALLWWGGGLCLFALTLVGSLWGSGLLILALIVAGLVGGLILIKPEYGVMVLTSTFFLSYPEVLQGSGRFTINNLVGLILAGTLIVTVALERRADFLHSKQVQLVLLIGFAILINQLLAERTPSLESLAHMDLTGKRVHELVTKFAFVIFFVAFIRTRWQILMLAWSVVFFVLMTAPNAIWNAVNAVGGIEQVRASADFGVAAAKNANRLAFIAAMAIALVGYALQQWRSRVALFFGGLAITLCVVTIFLSASRSGLISLIILLVLFTAKTMKHTKKRVILPLVFLLVVAVGLGLVEQARWWHFLQPYLDRMTNFFWTEQREEGAGSLRARLELLAVGSRMLRDHLIAGVGIGNFRWVSVVDYQNIRPAAQHNSYLLTLVEGGLLLFIPYLLLFRRTWKDLTLTRRLSAQVPSLRLGWLVEATQTVFLLFLVFSFFADMWHEIFLYLIIGLTAVLTRLYQHEAKPAQI